MSISERRVMVRSPDGQAAGAVTMLWCPDQAPPPVGAGKVGEIPSCLHFVRMPRSCSYGGFGLRSAGRKPPLGMKPGIQTVRLSVTRGSAQIEELTVRELRPVW